MHTATSRSPSRQFAIPAKPETGLAEWTERIKAMQRQVDADEEEEHRRLEEEIRVSRLARVRRSAGYGSRSATPLSPLPHTDDSPTSSGDVAGESASSTDRAHSRADTLSTLTSGGPTRTTTTPPSSHAVEPISLAAFIGGRATGPRLNKHAPQQDAHDPTLFEQRTINASTVPHPIFGRGGVAMPGLATKGRTRTEPILVSPTPPLSGALASDHSDGQAEKEQGAPSKREDVLIPKRERKNSNALKRYMDHVEQHAPPSPSPSLNSDPVRTRTLSTPASTWPPPISPSLSSKLDYGRPITPRTTAFPPVPSASLKSTPSPSSISPPAVPKSPVSYSRPSISASASRQLKSASTSPKPTFLGGGKSSPAPVSPKPAHLTSGDLKHTTVAPTPSLARPVQPEPKPSPFVPPAPPSTQRSPAFLRASASPKEISPSLTRLKGRGFVQSIVQASSQLSAPTELGQVSPVGGGTGPNGKRTSSVVDRWKLPVESEPAHPSLPPNKPLRKSWTSDIATASPAEKADPQSSTSVSPKPMATTPASKNEEDVDEPSWKSIEESARKIKKTASNSSLRKKSSSTSLRKKSSSTSLRKSSSSTSLKAPAADETNGVRPPSPGGRPMGSSSTMFSYIKPMKTGDDASYSHSHSRPATPAKSRSDVGTRSIRGLSSELPPSGKPLSHPTKDRARRPKKGSAIRPTVKDEAPSSQPARQATRQPSVSRLQQQQPQKVASPDPVDEAPSLETPKRGTITDRWTSQAVLGVKTFERPPQPTVLEKEKEKKGMVGARALPGLTSTPSASSPAFPTASVTPNPSPGAPRRRERIPSSGNRATVMDVALIMHEREASLSPHSPSSSPTLPLPEPSPVREQLGRDEVLIAPGLERRRSSYSSFISLPPVSEVRTPAHTLPRKIAVPIEEDEQPILSSAPAVPEKDAAATAEVLKERVPEVLHIQHRDEPVPSFDISTLASSVDLSYTYTEDPDVLTISVEILSIVGASPNTLPSAETAIFYETETLAIIHRFKTRTSGLVATKLWCWRGKGNTAGELELLKLEGLARRYATPLIDIRQTAEPPELIHTLGGTLSIRQGVRSLWGPDNITMHCVRLIDGSIITNEFDLAVSNMCSGFSYCFTFLGSCYIWHGRGSLPRERDAALAYAQSFVASDTAIVELTEGESDDDEMFWMMLGEREYAKADYWRWKRLSTRMPLASVWRTSAANTKAPFTLVPSIGGESDVHSSVYVIYCTWEIFVLVGKDARGNRADIRLAVAASQALSNHFARTRPFAPPVHVIVLPSKIPLDLRFHLRDFGEIFWNRDDTPDHMNIFPLHEALAHLERVSWNRSELRHRDMLPLGLDVSHILP